MNYLKVVVFSLLMVLLSGCGGSGGDACCEDVYTPPPVKGTVYDNADDVVGAWENYINSSGNSSISIITNAGNNVVHLQGEREDFFKLDIEPDNSTEFILNLDYRGRDDCFTIYVEIMTDYGKRFMQYTTFELGYKPPEKQEDENGVVYIRLSDDNGNQISHDSVFYNTGWHHLVLNLASDLTKVEPQNNIISVDSIRVSGGILLDNISLSNN